jgi:FkbM family methyltransferase
MRITLPNALLLKSLLVASPVEGMAKRVQKLLARRWRNLELAEIYLEDDRSISALSRLLTRDANCVDVGCHIGSFLSSILRICPDGHHIAIEASIKKSTWLKSKFPAVELHSVAISDKSGTAIFYEESVRAGYSRLHQPTSGASVPLKVETKTLDEILATKRRIDLIKLDIEGGELNALRGASNIIAKHKPVIYFECGSDHDLEQLSVSRRDIYDILTQDFSYEILTLPDFLFEKGSLSFDEFRKCGIYPFRAFNFLALPLHAELGAGQASSGPRSFHKL